MHASTGHALVVAALVASIVLLFHRDDRLFPVLALVASGLEALLVFHIVSLSSGKVPINTVLPALLAFSGAVCWTKEDGKTCVTASTVATFVGALQLLWALKILGA